MSNKTPAQMTRQNLIDKYAIAGTPFNEVAWRHFMGLAQDDKTWALNVTPEWFGDACQMSLEWREVCAKTNVLILAAKHYAYSFYRAAAKQGTYRIDPCAFELWQGFGVEV